MATAQAGSRARNPTRARAVKAKPEHPIQATTTSSMRKGMTTPKDGDKYQDSIVQPTCSTDDASVYCVDKCMEAIDNIMLEGLNGSQLCPWHTQQVTHVNRHVPCFDPMERYIAEAEAEQSAVYHGIQEGTLSITKDCTCAKALRGAVVSLKSSSVEHSA